MRRVFEEEVGRLEGLPNVLVRRDATPVPVEEVAEEIERHSTRSIRDVGSCLVRWAEAARGHETRLRLTLEVPVDHDDACVLADPREGDYYGRILERCEETIKSEVAGRNPYGEPQGLDSRRFYYSSDTCISSIHFLVRDGSLHVACGLRSTDARRNGQVDLRFLSHLSAAVPRTFGWNPERITLDVRFNSLHIRKDDVMM